VQDRINELAHLLKAGNGVEASAGRVADEELGATGECRRQNEECRMVWNGEGGEEAIPKTLPLPGARLPWHGQQRFLAWQKVAVGRR
jgi:hypothetical protein